MGEEYLDLGSEECTIIDIIQSLILAQKKQNGLELRLVCYYSVPVDSSIFSIVLSLAGFSEI